MQASPLPNSYYVVCNSLLLFIISLLFLQLFNLQYLQIRCLNFLQPGGQRDRGERGKEQVLIAHLRELAVYYQTLRELLAWHPSALGSSCLRNCCAVLLFGHAAWKCWQLLHGFQGWLRRGWGRTRRKRCGDGQGPADQHEKGSDNRSARLINCCSMLAFS